MSKKVNAILLTFALVFCAGCEKEICDEPKNSEDRVITNIRQLGQPVSNPINAHLCKDKVSAEATLSSLRRISDRFYYMDFTTNLHFEKLIKGGYQDNDVFNAAQDSLWFEKDGWEKPFDEEHPQCSGFVCFNEKGEVLFGRNFDGAGGPLCLVFNKANGKYKYIQFTAPNYNSALYNGISKKKEGENGDGILSNGTTSLHRLLRQPLATMDGINEHGLCFGAFQLPPFRTEEIPGPTRVMQNEKGKEYIANSLMQNLILSECKTVDEVQKMMESYNYVALHPSINVHWMVADATGDYAIFEYWENQLYVFRPKDRLDIMPLTSQVVPYEYNSIENYYVNGIATYTYMSDSWQKGYSSKVRVGNLMGAYASKAHLECFDGKYKPVMSEMEALKCLQEGAFAIEMYLDATNWSCIYNPAQKTILFNMRNDMSQIYKIDFNADFQ